MTGNMTVEGKYIACPWYPWGLVPEPHRYGGPSVSFWVSGEKFHPKSDFQTQQKSSRKAGSTVIVTLQGGDGGISRQCTFQQSLGSSHESCVCKLIQLSSLPSTYTVATVKEHGLSGDCHKMFQVLENVSQLFQQLNHQCIRYVCYENKQLFPVLGGLFSPIQ